MHYSYTPSQDSETQLTLYEAAITNKDSHSIMRLLENTEARTRSRLKAYGINDPSTVDDLLQDLYLVVSHEIQNDNARLDVHPSSWLASKTRQVVLAYQKDRSSQVTAEEQYLGENPELEVQTPERELIVMGMRQCYSEAVKVVFSTEDPEEATRIERNKYIHERRANGEDLNTIAEELGLTRDKVRQIERSGIMAIRYKAHELFGYHETPELLAHQKMISSPEYQQRLAEWSKQRELLIFRIEAVNEAFSLSKREYWGLQTVNSRLEGLQKKELHLKQLKKAYLDAKSSTAEALESDERLMQFVAFWDKKVNFLMEQKRSKLQERE